MTFDDWAVTIILLTIAVAVAIAVLAWKIAFDDGWEAGRLHEKNARNTARIRRNRLEAATVAMWGAEPDWDTWAASLRPAPSERLASTGELHLALAEHVGPHGAAAVLSDTGALAALTESTDAYLARMAADEAAYRKGLTS
jgi:hypothetical protein